ncbi:hypothetical protein QZH41_016928 [Actinostola sp. cb2023]|nr:hypothetical protein QZH41_016928 [Actinostola sp. cb2023]
MKKSVFLSVCLSKEKSLSFCLSVCLKKKV